MRSNSRNVKLPFLTVVDLPLHLPIWTLTIEMWNCYSWPLGASTGGGRSATSSANMTSNSRIVKLPFLMVVDLPLHLPIWDLTAEMWNHHSWPLHATTRGLDLPLHLPIWAPTVEMWNCHSWPLDATTRRVDLPLHLPIKALAVEMWNCHSWLLDASTGRIDLPVDLPLYLPIWALTVEMYNCYSCPLDASTGGRSATLSANMSSNSRNVKLPFLTTRCQYWGVDLPLYLSIWALIIEMWNCYSWPLDASTVG